MNKAINDIKTRAEELFRVFGKSEINYITRMAPILMNAFKTRQFNRSHGVEVAACILSLINIADDKNNMIEKEPIHNLSDNDSNNSRESRIIKFSNEI